MTQTLPDLTRPTTWRLYVCLAWGGTVPPRFLQDAIVLVTRIDA